MQLLFACDRMNGCLLRGTVSSASWLPLASLDLLKDHFFKMKAKVKSAFANKSMTEIYSRCKLAWQVFSFLPRTIGRFVKVISENSKKCTPISGFWTAIQKTDGEKRILFLRLFYVKDLHDSFFSAIDLLCTQSDKES